MILWRENKIEKYIRCRSEMIEYLDIKVDMQDYGICITKLGIFSDTIEKPKVPVCPKYGEISMHIENIEKLIK